MGVDAITSMHLIRQELDDREKLLYKEEFPMPLFTGNTKKAGAEGVEL